METGAPRPCAAGTYKDHKVRQDHAVTRQMIVDHVLVCRDAGIRNDRAHRWMLGMITTVLLMLGGYGLRMLMAVGP